MNLTSTNQTLELSTSTTDTVDWVVSYTDIDKTGATAITPGSAQGTVSASTETTIVTAPAASIYRVVTSLTVRNIGAGTQVVQIQKDISGTEYEIMIATLLTGEALVYEDAAGWDRYNAGGERLGRGAPGANGTNGAPGAPGVGFTGTATLDFGGHVDNTGTGRLDRSGSILT